MSRAFLFLILNAKWGDHEAQFIIMKKSILKWVFVVMLCSFSSCSSDDEPNANQPDNNESNEVDDSKIFASIDYSEMVAVEGGTFWMGAQSNDNLLPNYNPEAERDESPVHEVILDDFI